MNNTSSLVSLCEFFSETFETIEELDLSIIQNVYKENTNGYIIVIQNIYAFRFNLQ